MTQRARGTSGTSGYRLIVQPGDGVEPLVAAIDKAKSRVEILIFRFDRTEIEQALIRAVSRGVIVQALIAWTNHGGERNLRNLETRLLGAGVTVARTADDLTRYHGKMLIVDRKVLYVLAFNFTALDIERSRSFGIVTGKPRLVAEAAKLFEADSSRQPYSAGLKTLLVSPINARAELAAFVEGAKKELLIYDPCLDDPHMIRLLEDRNRAGVQIRVIGRLKGSGGLTSYPLAQMRLHTRMIVRDGREAFLGSQSLRAAELDGRREIGIIFSHQRVVATLIRVFEGDWKLAEAAGQQPEAGLSGDKLAKKVARAITRELPPLSEVIDTVVEQRSGREVDLDGVDLEALEETVRSAVKNVVKETIQEAASKAATP